MNKIFYILVIIILVLIIAGIAGYFSAGYLLNKYYGPEYFYIHPSIAKFLNVSPVCPTVCLQGGVCGGDGKNYCNECIAFQHGAGYAHDGPCQQVQPTVNPTAGWSTYTDATSGLTFQYPSKLNSDYIHLLKPVVIINSKTPIDNDGCYHTAPVSASHVLDSQFKTAGMQFCVSQSEEGAAGTYYNTYYYTTLNNGSHYTLSFVVSEPDCGVFGGPTMSQSDPAYKKYQACTNDEKNNYDSIATKEIQRSVSTLKFTPAK